MITEIIQNREPKKKTEEIKEVPPEEELSPKRLSRKEVDEHNKKVELIIKRMEEETKATEIKKLKMRQEHD